MNPFFTNVNFGTNTFNAVHNRRAAEPVWQNGQTITAMLERIDDGTASLRAQGDVLFYADASVIRGDVGERLTFSVRRGAQGYELTQIDTPVAVIPERGRATSMDAIKDFTQTMEGIKENNEYRAESLEEKNAKVARAIAAIRRSQHFIANTGGKSAVAAMVESGIDLSKVSFAALDRIMQHVDRRPTELMPGDERFFSHTHGALMVGALHRHGLPVSERNIAQLENAWERIPAKINDSAAAQLINSEAELTLDNVYKSNYATPSEKLSDYATPPVKLSDYATPMKKLSEYTATPVIPSDYATPPENPYRAEYNATAANPADEPARWETHRAALERLFAQEEIPLSQENLTAARFLFARDLPVTIENISKLHFLNRLPQAFEDENTRTVFYNRAAEFISRDIPLGTLPLSDIVRMAEAQLKMATEAAARHQNLHINTDMMRDNLKQLTLLEAENYLKMVGAEAGLSAISGASRLVGVFDALANFAPLTANVHANILRSIAPFTIEGINKSVTTARLNAGYAQNATVPSARYGDSFAAVKSQFTPLLTGMNITPTNETLKAAFILSRNQMDVTPENLYAVKEIDAKITAISNKLHPLIAANMIKEGLNPLEMHADALLAYIRRFNHDMGENGAEKLARYIRETDESNAIDSDTRKTMIAVYRMLHVIQKDGAAALGLAAQMNTPLTLGNLLDLAQNRENRKRSPLDISVNDALGALERITRPEGNIRQTITAGIAQHLTHFDIVTDTFTDAAPPSALEKILQSNEQMAAALEDLAAEAAQTGQTTSLTSLATAARQLQAFTEANPDIILKLQNRNISARTSHIQAAQELENNERALENALTEAVTGNIITPDSDVFINDITTSNYDIFKTESEALENALPAADLTAMRTGATPAQILAQIRAALGEDITPRIDALLAVTHGLNGDAEQGFDLPVRINGRISHLKMYVTNDRALTADGARIFLSLDTARLGKVSAYFTLTHNPNGEPAMDVNISAESPAALATLQTQRNNLLTLALEAGLEINNVNFIKGEHHG